MNHWKIIQLAYHKYATSTRIIEDILKSTKFFDRLFLILCIVGICVSLGITYNNNNLIAWGLFAFLYAAFLFKFDTLKRNLIVVEYGEHMISNSSLKKGKTRYLVFKSELDEKGITKAQVEECFPLLDMQIDCALSERSTAKSLWKNTSSFLIGFLSSVWFKADVSQLIWVGLCLIIFGSILGLILYFIPSDIERYKEMKYFMMLYCLKLS